MARKIMGLQTRILAARLPCPAAVSSLRGVCKAAPASCLVNTGARTDQRDGGSHGECAAVAKRLPQRTARQRAGQGQQTADQVANATCGASLRQRGVIANQRPLGATACIGQKQAPQ
ncbi:hypothetical protein [Immundisolibacter sp.]